jgi:hypothetical protein
MNQLCTALSDGQNKNRLSNKLLAVSFKDFYSHKNILTSSFLTQSFFGERFAHNKLYVKI